MVSNGPRLTQAAPGRPHHRRTQGGAHVPKTHVAGFRITFCVLVAAQWAIAPRDRKGMGYVPLARNIGGVGWLGLDDGGCGAQNILVFALRPIMSSVELFSGI